MNGNCKIAAQFQKFYFQTFSSVCEKPWPTYPSMQTVMVIFKEGANFQGKQNPTKRSDLTRVTCAPKDSVLSFEPGWCRPNG